MQPAVGVIKEAWCAPPSGVDKDNMSWYCQVDLVWSHMKGCSDVLDVQLASGDLVICTDAYAYFIVGFKYKFVKKSGDPNK